jgi:glycosyltransferase involved in cell wall biosynthesis
MMKPATETAVFAIPGDLSAPTGGYAYARRLLQALPGLKHLLLPGDFPHPSERDLSDASARLAAVPRDTILLIDGLAFGVLPEAVLDTIRAPIVALIHHPLCLEAGLSEAACDALRRSEQIALGGAAQVIATSQCTADQLSLDFGVPAARITIAEPGTMPARRAHGTGYPPRLLTVGSVVPRKGYDLLVHALVGLADLPWTLTIAGALDRDPETVQALRAAVVQNGLTGRIILAGAPNSLDHLYDSADIFVVSSLHEGYGMAAAEAISHGLPLVTSTAGALATTVPDAAALKYLPGDIDALRTALRHMLTDPVCRDACAAAAWVAAQTLPRWDHTASRVREALHTARHRADATTSTPTSAATRHPVG